MPIFDSRRNASGGRKECEKVRTHINSTGVQLRKIYLSLSKKKDNIVGVMKQNYTKHVYGVL